MILRVVERCQSWLSRSRKGLPTEGSDWWKILINKDVE